MTDNLSQDQPFDPNFDKLRTFFIDFQQTHEIDEKTLGTLDLVPVLADLLRKFPFLKPHIRKNLARYPRKTVYDVKPLLKQLQSLKSELITLKKSQKSLVVAIQEAISGLITAFSAQKGGQKEELLAFEAEIERLLRENKTLEGLNSELKRKSNEFEERSVFIDQERTSFYKERTEFLQKSNETRAELEKKRLLLSEEEKRIASIELEKRSELEKQRLLLFEGKASIDQELANLNRERDEFLRNSAETRFELEKQRLLLAEEEKRKASIDEEITKFYQERDEFLQKSAETRSELEKQRLVLVEEEKRKASIDQEITNFYQERDEFLQKSAETRSELEKQRLSLAEEEKRIENLREVIMMNEKLQENSPFSFQQSHSKPKETKKRFYSSLETPDKSVSVKSETIGRSQRKTPRSIFEGLRFIHRDDNKEELGKIGELEKRAGSVKKEEILPHLLENKTREKKKLEYFRDKIKRQKQEGKTAKSGYRMVRESSLKKMKGILSQKKSEGKRK